jgi:hypothetical protein
MIIAPITVAVESLTTPADAITADSSSNSQKRLSPRLRSAPSKNTWPRIRSMSPGVRLVTTVVPPARARSGLPPEESIPRRKPQGQSSGDKAERLGWHGSPSHYARADNYSNLAPRRYAVTLAFLRGLQRSPVAAF